MLVLSVFPGIGLLDRAFEEEGFTVVRGPDVLWGGDVRRFHPPAGKFDGIIGGPPCQAFSALAALQRHNGRAPKYGNLVPEFERCVREAAPAWFLMENVPDAPLPSVPGYGIHAAILNNRELGAPQNRVRRFSFGCRGGRRLLNVETVALHNPVFLGAVTSSDGGKSVRMTRYKVPEACVAQGLPDDFLKDAPFTAEGKLRVVANGVPLPMGRAIARAVREAVGGEA